MFFVDFCFLLIFVFCFYGVAIFQEVLACLSSAGHYVSLTRIASVNVLGCKLQA